MSDNSPYMLAGPGLLRSESTLTVNPNMKLRTLIVRDKLTVPTTLDTTDAASKKYVDDAVSTGGIVSGTGITINDQRQVSLADDLVVRSIKLTGQTGSSGPTSVVNKAYVDAAVSPLVTQQYVNDNFSNLATQNDILTQLEPYATRVYVTSFNNQF